MGRIGTAGAATSTGFCSKSKLGAAAGTDEAVKFLVGSAYAQGGEELRTAALVSLWLLLHGSEQAKAVLRAAVRKLDPNARKSFEGVLLSSPQRHGDSYSLHHAAAETLQSAKAAIYRTISYDRCAEDRNMLPV